MPPHTPHPHPNSRHPHSLLDRRHHSTCSWAASWISQWRASGEWRQQVARAASGGRQSSLTYSFSSAAVCSTKSSSSIADRQLRQGPLVLCPSPCNPPVASPLRNCALLGSSILKDLVIARSMNENDRARTRPGVKREQKPETCAQRCIDAGEMAPTPLKMKDSSVQDPLASQASAPGGVRQPQ